MHSHEHCCEHKNLKYCNVCKVVYCVDCKKEWKEGYWWYPNYYPLYPLYTATPTITSGSTYSINTETTGCTHS